MNIEYSERDHTDQPPIALQPERADPDPIMKILVSNDDGYLATGINVLTTALEAVADIVVMAPDRNRSAASNSLTLSNPLRVSKVAPNRYKVDGTPSDCVHLALTGFLDFEPDLVVSGINHGANLGDDVIYSGTVAAAMEGRFLDDCRLIGGAQSRAFPNSGSRRGRTGAKDRARTPGIGCGPERQRSQYLAGRTQGGSGDAAGISTQV